MINIFWYIPVTQLIWSTAWTQKLTLVFFPPASECVVLEMDPPSLVHGRHTLFQWAFSISSPVFQSVKIYSYENYSAKAPLKAWLLFPLAHVLSILFYVIKNSECTGVSCRPMASMDVRPAYVQLHPQTARWPECRRFYWKPASVSRTSPALSSYYWSPPLKG